MGMLFVPAPARAMLSTEGASGMSCMEAERTRMRVRLPGAVADVVVFAELGVNRGGNRVQRLNLIVHGSILRLKLLHEIDELLHALDGHGVIDAGAHAADDAVPLEVHQPLRGGLLDEFRVQRRGRR